MQTWPRFDQPGNLTFRIAAHLREMIETEQLAVGERLPSEREMARMLGVGRPALREAVKLLEASGQLVVHHGVGVFVSADETDPMRITLAEHEGTLTDLFAMREVLERAAAAWATERATAGQIETLYSILELERQACEEPIDFKRLAELNTEFHLQIVAIAGNRFLSRTVGILHEMIAAGMETTLLLPGRVERSIQEHGAILEAMKANDPEAAGREIAEHIRGARDAALERVRTDALAPTDDLTPLP
ncbi:MAG TPA: FCD domain-containing protein [Solirubrobacteraceae bacterium]|nr:FCD domain-containing protein [Solirubrobacteraceae bacterium]